MVNIVWQESSARWRMARHWGQEQVPVILVGHKKDTAGLQRTRRLFTTLNKTAVPVRKRDIIALDEDDVMAIIARRLVETNKGFRDPKIAVISSQNIPIGNRTCLTTISSLYDILKVLFMFEVKQHSDRALRFRRPSDERLDQYYSSATSFFISLGKTFKPVGDLFKTANPTSVTEKHRGPHGGHLLFRPIGLDIFTRTAVEIAQTRNIELTEAVTYLKRLPTDLASAPYQGIIWDSNRHTILRGKALAQELVRYIANLPVDEIKLKRNYNLALGKNEAEVDLPPRLTE